MWLVKCVKRFVSKNLATANTLNSLKPCTTALSSSCFKTFAKIELENVHHSVAENLGVFFSTVTDDDKCSLRNREKLQQPI